METKTITLTADEIEDIRFCLALVAEQNEDKASNDPPEALARAMTEQADRFRVLARKVTGS